MSAAPPHVPTRRSLETLGASFSDTSAVVRALHNGYTTGQAGTGENKMMGQVVDDTPPDPDRVYSWPFMWSRAKVAPMRRGLGGEVEGLGLGTRGQNNTSSHMKQSALDYCSVYFVFSFLPFFQQQSLTLSSCP